MTSHLDTIIDSHVHMDLLQFYHPDRIGWLSDRHMVSISWSYGVAIETETELKRYLKRQSDFIDRMNQEGRRTYFLCGIHPRNIPKNFRPERVRELILPMMDNPWCRGIGEIGLETGSQKEKEILAAHLELAETIRQMDKRFGIHTPRKNKPETTRQTLALLSDYPGINPLTVIDHCTPETVGWVLKKKYHAGITLSAEKTSLQELMAIVKAHPDAVNRMMCNTDSGSTFHKDLYRFACAADFSVNTRRHLAFENAMQFFGIGEKNCGRLDP